MRVLITCGGTGGHIYPGIAIADKIKQTNKDAEILFVGTKNGMENQLVPAAGYAITGIDARGFDRHHLASNFKTVHDTLAGSSETKEILTSFKPDIAIGTGGYVTGPVLLQAHNHHIPCFIHEQNAMPGVANRMISLFADKVFVCFDGIAHYFTHPDRVIYTGNPVRSEFYASDRQSCRNKLGLRSDEMMLLIFGGSLGAQIINEEAIKLIKNLRSDKLRIVFITGNRYYESILKSIDADHIPPYVNIMSYAYNMPELMSAADIIVSRSGAVAVSEISACGTPSILIPSPNVTANHQYYNAKALSDKGAAVLIQESKLLDGSASLENEVRRMLDDAVFYSNIKSALLNLPKDKAVDIIYNHLGI